MVTQTFPVAFTPAELAYLGALLGDDSLPPLPGGAPTDEALAEAKASLITRRILEERESDLPIVNLSVALMLGALCYPQSSLCLTLRQGSAPPEVTWFHLTRNLSISLLTGGASPLCLLQAYPGPAAVLYAIMGRLAPLQGEGSGARASLERLGAGGSLQLSAAQGLQIETPAGIERREATAESIQSAVWTLLQSAWPREEAVG